MHNSQVNPSEAPVVIVTGAGRGLGRAHALQLAREGWRVVVNDADTALAGDTALTEAGAHGSADAVAAEIVKMGGTALANTERVTSWATAGALIDATLAHYGRIDALVANAGVIRDRPLVDMREADFSALTDVNLLGYAGLLHHLGRHWQSRAEASGTPAHGRVVLTASSAAFWPDVCRANYNAAKAGVIALGRSAALEFATFAAQVNVITPYARTRMTVSLDPDLANVPNDRWDPWDPQHVANLVAWLVSPDCTLNGEVLEVHAAHIARIAPLGRSAVVNRDTPWERDEISDAVRTLMQPTPAAVDEYAYQ